MRTDLFDFDLPSDRIALRPASPRDAARLLVVRPGAPAELEDRVVRDLPDLLRPGDQLVVNDTKVIPAQLRGRRIGRGPDARVDATLIKRLDGARWQALVKPARKLEPGDVVRFGEEGKVCFLAQLDATVEAKGEAGEVTFGFAFTGRRSMPPSPSAARCRCRPISPRAAPPTTATAPTTRPCSRARRARWRRRPPACISPKVSPRGLAARGIAVHTVTLHVGAGTFLPVKAEESPGTRCTPNGAQVSAETAAALNAARAAGGRIVAVGTTSLRLLESAAGDDRHHRAVLQATPRSSSRRATASAPSTCC